MIFLLLIFVVVIVIVVDVVILFVLLIPEPYLQCLIQIGSATEILLLSMPLFLSLLSLLLLISETDLYDLAIIS